VIARDRTLTTDSLVPTTKPLASRGRIIWIVIGAVVLGLPLLAALIGSMLPRDHVAQVALDLAAPPDRVWALVSDVTGTSRWRSDVQAVELQEPVDGHMRWVEKTKQGPTPFELISQNPPSQQVVRVVDEGLPFGGTWTWELTPTSGGTRVLMTEAGFVRNPIFRVMGRLFFKPTGTLESYLGALAEKLGEASSPIILRER
jgi:uncharacterized protein YndB with AHSA1/START domain